VAALEEGVADGLGGLAKICVGVGTGGRVSSGGADEVAGAGTAGTVAVTAAAGAVAGGTVGDDAEGDTVARGGRAR
jgi:hypothetical protein